MDTDNNWQKAVPEIFWREMSPGEHVVQVYENEEILLKSLFGFVYGGLKSGDCVILIANKMLLDGVEKLLAEKKLCLKRARENDQYITLDAEQLLERIMANDWPDETRFKEVLVELLDRGNGRTIRAFGEMVTFLWENGRRDATIRLEQLWTLFCNSAGICLFCAYPARGFQFDKSNGLNTICMEHSKVIRNGKEPDEILFRKVEKANY
jgi:hypothetical protein